MTFRWIDNNPFNRDLPVWTRAYACEMLPGPVTPLGWDVVWAGGAIDGWRDAMIDRMGFRPEEINADAPELIGVFGGYAYLNASLLRVWAARTPALAPNHVDTAFLTEHPEMPVYVPDDWHVDADISQGPLTRWLSSVLAERNQSELEAGHLLSAEVTAKRPDLGALSDGELVERVLGLRPVVRALFSQHINQTLAASIGPGIIAAICDEIGLPTSATALISGLGDVESVSPTHAIWTLSRLVRSSLTLSDMFDLGVDGLSPRLRASEDLDVVSFVAGLDALSSEVGYRAVVEWEPRGPTWETEPNLALSALDRLRRHSDDVDPGVAFAQREGERRSLVKEIGDLVVKQPVTKDHFDAAVASTEVFIRGRARSKANVSRVIHEIRVTVAELAERADQRGDIAEPADIHMLFADELEYYADGGLSKIRSIAGSRRAHYEWLLTLDAPFIVKSEPLPADRRPPPAFPPTAGLGPPAERAMSDVLFGKPGSPGTGRGRARVMTDPTIPPDLAVGDVLIAPFAPPVWAPLFVGLAAVVIEGGGLLSHAAIINRELGVPTVVRALGATGRIPDGATVEVDGTTGLVTVFEGPIGEGSGIEGAVAEGLVFEGP